MDPNRLLSTVERIFTMLSLIVGGIVLARLSGKTELAAALIGAAAGFATNRSDPPGSAPSAGATVAKMAAGGAVALALFGGLSGCADVNWRALLADGSSCAQPALKAAASGVADELAVEVAHAVDVNMPAADWSAKLEGIAVSAGVAALECAGAHLLSDLEQEASAGPPHPPCHAPPPGARRYLEAIFRRRR